MTPVVRITSTLTSALLAIVTLLSLSADADGQIFRRLRENIRSNYSPQVPVRTAPVQVAPQPLRPEQRQFGQSLTPYSRLTPEQRSIPTPPQPNRNLNAGNQNAQPDRVNVRVVTYFDPRTGRTYQRRFISPANGTDTRQAGRQSIAQGNSPAAASVVPNRPTYDKIPTPIDTTPSRQLSTRPRQSVVQQPVAQQPKFDIPPISPEQPQSPIQQPNTTTQQLPTLAGPETFVANPVTVARPAITAPEMATSTIEPAAGQVEPSLGISITETPSNDDGDIQIDAAVTPAAATSDDITTGSLVSDGAPSTAFSVLEVWDDNEGQESLDSDIEIDAVDEVEAFFAQ